MCLQSPNPPPWFWLAVPPSGYPEPAGFSSCTASLNLPNTCNPCSAFKAPATSDSGCQFRSGGCPQPYQPRIADAGPTPLPILVSVFSFSYHMTTACRIQIGHTHGKFDLRPLAPAPALTACCLHLLLTCPLPPPNPHLIVPLLSLLFLFVLMASPTRDWCKWLSCCACTGKDFFRQDGAVCLVWHYLQKLRPHTTSGGMYDTMVKRRLAVKPWWD